MVNESMHKIILMVTLFVLSMCDYHLTHYILADGGIEANAIMNWLYKSFGVGSMLLFKTSALVIMACVFRYMSITALILLNFAQLIPVLYGSYLISVVM